MSRTWTVLYFTAVFLIQDINTFIKKIVEKHQVGGKHKSNLSIRNDRLTLKQ